MEGEAPIFEGENFRSSQQKFGYKDIVLQQVRKIVNIYSRELTSGFFKKTQPNESGKQEIIAYIPDYREAFINSVSILSVLLKAKFDKVMKEEDKELQKKITEEHKTIKEKEDKENKGLREEWLKQAVPLMIDMFQNLCGLLERLGWLSETSEED